MPGVFVLLMFRVFFFGFILGLVDLSLGVLAMSGSVFGAFLRRVGCEFRAIGSTARFHFGGFFQRETGDRFGLNFFRLGGFFFVLFFLFVIEFRAANESVCFGFIGGFFVLGFDEIRG